MWTIEKPPANGHVADPNIETLLRELATLRSQNKKLKSQLAKKDRRSSIVERAIVDAHSILTEAFSTGATSRLDLERIHGMSRRRWQWACAALRYAGIISMDKRRWRAGLDFLIDDLATAISLLEKAASELLPGGYNRLLKLVRL